MKSSKGFTLVEVMIVVVIVAILAAVAVPAYSGYVRRGAIAEATSNLSGLRVRLEQYYQDNRTYQVVPVNGTECGVAMPVPPEVKYFSFSCAADTADTYVITATGIDNMTNFEYTIDQQNAKTSTITAEGWTGNVACWATKQDGSC